MQVLQLYSFIHVAFTRWWLNQIHKKQTERKSEISAFIVTPETEVAHVKLSAVLWL